MTRAAADDMRGIRAYIATHGDPVIAERVAGRIGNVIANLALFPHIGHHGHVPGTFELLVPRLPFVVIYRIDYADADRELIVLRVYHTAQGRS